jgi:hypothetical protein
VNKKSQKKLNDFRNYFSKVILILFMVVLGVEATVRISSSLGILGDFQMAYIDENLLKLPQSNSSNSTVADAVIVGDEMIENVKINFQGKSVLNLAGKDKTLADYNKLVEIAETYRAKNIFYFISANDFKIENNTPIRQLTTNSITPLIEAKSIAEDWNNLVKEAPKYSAFYHFMKSFKKAPEGISLKRAGMFFVMKDKKYWDQYLDIKDEQVEYGTQVNEEQLKAAQRFCKNKKIGFYVFLIPTKEMVYGPFSPSSEKYFSTQHEKLYKNFVSEMSGENFKIYDLTPYYREKARENVKAFYSLKDGLNEKGSRLLTEFIEEKVK